MDPTGNFGIEGKLLRITNNHLYPAHAAIHPLVGRVIQNRFVGQCRAGMTYHPPRQGIRPVGRQDNHCLSHADIASEQLVYLRFDDRGSGVGYARQFFGSADVLAYFGGPFCDDPVGRSGDAKIIALVFGFLYLNRLLFLSRTLGMDFLFQRSYCCFLLLPV